METDFRNAKVGDRVWSFIDGWGVVDEIRDNPSMFPVRVEFTGRKMVSFSMNGVQYVDENQVLFWDEIKFNVPTMPKRKVKKTVEYWVNQYEDIDCIYRTKDEADLSADADIIACVKVTGEYEVEE